MKSSLTALKLALAASLFAGCASSPDGQPYLYLQSGAYGCGAAEGLGCGLRVAPVLESLDALEGIAHSEVSWDGSVFRIELEPGADRERLTAAASGLLEGESRSVPAPQRADERWFDAAGTVALSRHEAGVIAADLGAELCAAVPMQPREAEQVRTALREELEHAFERAHAAGGTVPRLWEQLPQSMEDFQRRLEFLTAEQRAGVSAWLESTAREG